MNYLFDFNKFRLWATSDFDIHSGFLECLVSEKDIFYNYYVNLHKDERFPFIDFRFPPNSKELSEEEFKIKQAEYNSFLHRKDMGMPMWKLHMTTWEKLVHKLRELDNESLK